MANAQIALVGADTDNELWLIYLCISVPSRKIIKSSNIAKHSEPPLLL